MSGGCGLSRYAGLASAVSGIPPPPLPADFRSRRKFCDSAIHAAPKPESIPLPPSEWMSSYPLPLVGIPKEMGTAVQKLKAVLHCKAA
ncbi:hypothetical protein T265_01152 [Opisthorchis viverrini]|uniref:Uncharacterized protein n=1 Tax=Opisthorchis viverrini TaxID=6198 RepID=A0A075AAP2_OPIVI|nr:hypothetical protein T265_01152 [Opisthorchis viverrini]KER32865.1 hypothetical protein T265_01152 [Opisthorchis viverrini]